MADPPATINIRGQLLDAQGHALPGLRDFSVQFYDAGTGGASLGSVILGQTEVSIEGLFNITVTLPPQVMLSPQAWYEVAVASGPEPAPLTSADLFPNRIKMESVPFSLESAEAAHVDVSAIGSGSVLEAEFSYLSGVTSGIQDQLDAKANAADVYTKGEVDTAMTTHENDVTAHPNISVAHATSADTATSANDANTVDGSHASAFAAKADGVPSTAIVMSETNPNANLTGYTCIGSSVLNVTSTSLEIWAATTTTGAPTPRREHSAVWTGTEMIVWGGFDDNDLNTGGRYNPVTDTWTATTTTGAPTPRIRHSTVWTGTEMIIWSGIYVDNSGGRYNPATNTRTATTTTGAPISRNRHSAVWTGSQMIVWGGWGSAVWQNTGGRYNPTTNTWTATTTTNAPLGREEHTAVWTGSQMIVWGGYAGSSTYYNTGGRYDPVTNTWTPTSTTGAPTIRGYHSAVWTGSLMIVWGGYDGSGTLNTGGRYDPVTDTWTPTSTTNAPTGRRDHPAIWTGSKMVVWGGSGTNTGGWYDPVTDTWTPMTTTGAPSGRSDHTAVWTGSQMVAWGGFGGGYLNTGGRWSDSQTSTVTMYLFRKN